MTGSDIWNACFISLWIWNCPNITDQGLEILWYLKSQDLTSLTSLCLNFENCSNLTDAGLEILYDHGLRDLKCLTSLSLNFENCEKITDQGLQTLRHEKIHSMKLTSLFLIELGIDNKTSRIRYTDPLILHPIKKPFLSDELDRKVSDEKPLPAHKLTDLVNPASIVYLENSGYYYQEGPSKMKLSIPNPRKNYFLNL